MTTIKQVLAAKRPKDLFGTVNGLTIALRLDALSRKYRELSKVVHPDATSDPEAGAAFAHLSELRDKAERLIAAGHYDDVTTVELRGTTRTYVVHEPMWVGNASNVYLDDSGKWVVKVFTPADSDLAAREAECLKKLRAAPSPGFYLGLEEHFRARSGKDTQAVTVLERVEGLLSYTQVKIAYPNGIPLKAMAWMFRRLLIAIDQAHVLGFVHGAVIPEHVLVQPEQHGLVLIDWKYSVPIGSALRAVPRGRRNYYSARALTKDLVGPWLDLSMAAYLMEYIVGERLQEESAKRIRTFLRACRSDSKLDAATALKEFTDLIERMWGPRKFVPFALPHAGA